MTGKEITFDLAKFFNVETEERITTLASPDMIVGRLNRLLGDNNDHDQFSEKITIRMNEVLNVNIIHRIVLHETHHKFEYDKSTIEIQ